MREIKFRAWHKSDKKIYEVIAFNLGKWFLRGKSHPMPRSAIEVMQYTGLKDKNGVEIYECDIFKATHNFGPGGMHERISSVAFDLEKGYQWEYWDLDTIEVIGNIYENPELLDR